MTEPLFPCTNAPQTPNPPFWTTKTAAPKFPQNGGSTPTPCLDKAVHAQGGGGGVLPVCYIAVTCVTIFRTTRSQNHFAILGLEPLTSLFHVPKAEPSGGGGGVGGAPVSRSHSPGGGAPLSGHFQALWSRGTSPGLKKMKKKKESVTFGISASRGKTSFASLLIKLPLRNFSPEMAKIYPPPPCNHTPNVRPVPPHGGEGLHPTTVALKLQQFQYNLRKIFLRHLVFPMLFW